MSLPVAERVIVLGMDGLDPRILERLMDDGRAPAFARLRSNGGYRRLATTTPPQSPVAWSTIATGCNPGHHGVFDFIRRDPHRYLPELSILRPNPRNVLGRRSAMFLPPRQGTAFWNVTSEAGIPTSVIRWPLTLPPEKVTGYMLSGLGVPDLKANLGRYTFYTTRDIPPSEAQRRKGDIIRLPPNAETIHTSIPGPERSTVPMQLRVDRGAHQVTIKLAEQEVTLGERQWSDWVRVKFTMHFVRTVRGLCRFYLNSLASHIELYLSPVQADPRDPAFIISHPDGYAAELAEAIGDYHTLGMPEDTNALMDGGFDADAFLAQCNMVMAERERMLWHELGRLSHGLLAFVFDTTDRIQHVFWRARDPEHPAYDEAFARRHSSVIEDYYCRMDRILGNVLESVGEKTVVIVLSDHGFTSFRRAVHLNTWLVQNGLMVLKEPTAAEEPTLLRNVEWARTRAYALGFSSIYLNLAGREGKGIVSDGDEAAALRRQIADMLVKLADPASGQRVIQRVYTREELYAGPFLEGAPDLVVGFRPGYRASWQTAVGGCGSAPVEDNLEGWGGDHVVDPSHVPGVLAASRAVRAWEARACDAAVSIVRLLGLPGLLRAEGRELFGD
ncbi:MAG TPA: alkaline phosphatase family protein [Planctomycetota bacterium]|nr:alkaline phosphatase family protein [Planctomycetota bacterium]